jgi:hypothetical protein
VAVREHGTTHRCAGSGERVTTPAKRRKIIIRKRETSDPKAIQNARSLCKDLFAEMGPEGEDWLAAYLQTKLKDYQE